MIDPLYTLSGFAVGTMVGMTGVGGGSLMTPLLILLFGIHPATAVGTDLVFAGSTKVMGAAMHARSRTIEWRVVGLLALGSVPATVLTVAALWWTHLDTRAVSVLITPILAVSLMLTAVLVLFQEPVLQVLGPVGDRVSELGRVRVTIAAGVALGVLVSLSSVGAGALGVTALTLLYPRIPLARIVGSDIAHAIPLTFLAGSGYWLMGSVDTTLLLSLLTGSWPGIVVGSLLATRVPVQVLRTALAAVLAVSGLKLLV